MSTRSQFGYIRKLPSGRYQASYIGPTGDRQYAPTSFRTKKDAGNWLSRVESDLSSGAWTSDALARTALGTYAESYLTDNPEDIGDRWAETCRRNMRLHLAPLLGLPLASITGPIVRRWYTDALAGDGGRTSIAQSYRFLRAVLNQAVRDGAIIRNPCHIKGAGVDSAPERPIASPKQVDELIEACTPWFRAAIVLAAWCGLRRGEICGLLTPDVDLDHNIIWVRQSRAELLQSAHKYDKAPKTAAGYRKVHIPPHVIRRLREHRANWAGEQRFFVSRDGSPMRGNTVYQAFVRARTKTGIDISFHDLRHTGLTLAAASGATIADLKNRHGHSTNRASLRYLHTVEGRDQHIATALSRIATTNDASTLPNHLWTATEQ